MMALLTDVYPGDRFVIGVGVIAEDMKRSGVHAALVSPNEATESILVATPSPLEIGVLLSHGD